MALLLHHKYSHIIHLTSTKTVSKRSVKSSPTKQWHVQQEELQDGFKMYRSRAYLYQFTHEADEVAIIDPGIFGVYHSAEVPFVFNVPDGVYKGIPVVFAANERQLAYNMVDLWSQFAATGSPGSASGVTWPLYTAQTDQNIRLDLNLTIVQNLKKEQCDFWDSVDSQIPIGGFNYAEKMEFLNEMRRESIRK
jgi:carboxylesterase type B